MIPLDTSSIIVSNKNNNDIINDVNIIVNNIIIFFRHIVLKRNNSILQKQMIRDFKLFKNHFNIDIFINNAIISLRNGSHWDRFVADYISALAL